MSEDEELDGMALGELRAIVQDAKKIYQCVKNGTPLEAWMYKKITNSNESLTAVAQQIDNPGIRSPEGVAEGSDSYTVANDPDKPGMYSYREIGHALQSGHSDHAKIYKNNKFLSTVGDARKSGVAEGQGDKPFDNMMTTIKTGTKKQATADRREQKRQDQERTRTAISNMFGSSMDQLKNLKIKEQGVAEGSEQINEYRDRMYQYIRSIVPTWPEYVVQDWLYKGRGKNKNYTTDSKAVKDEIIEMIIAVSYTHLTLPTIYSV